MDSVPLRNILNPPPSDSIVPKRKTPLVISRPADYLGFTIDSTGRPASETTSTTVEDTSRVKLLG